MQQPGSRDAYAAVSLSLEAHPSWQRGLGQDGRGEGTLRACSATHFSSWQQRCFSNCWSLISSSKLLGCDISDPSKVPAAVSTPSLHPDVALPISSARLRSTYPRALRCNFRHQVSLTVKVINKEPISGPRGRGQGGFLSTGGSAGPGCFVQPVLDRWLLHNSFAYCERAAVPGGRARRSAAAPDRRGCCPRSRPSPPGPPVTSR